MAFHLGKPILVMLLMATVSGGWLLWRPAPPPRADLVVWVFAESHARTYRDRGEDGSPSLVERFEQRTGKRVDVQLISGRSQAVRLASIFMSQTTGDVVPDLVEVEIGQVGRYFRPPLSQVGFLPLD